MTFDDTLPTLVRLCEGADGVTSLRRICVVRDVRGRLRLVIDPDPAAPPVDVAALEKALGAELGEYFALPVWSTAGEKDQGRLSSAVFAHSACSTWPDAAYDDPVTGRTAVPARARWFRLERRLSKDAWLDTGQPYPPWPLGTAAGIVTFYSFKGGVGRTTALVSCAWQLAREGKRVVVIDLDLEAPGLGQLLDGEAERGTVDFLVDHLATGADRIDGLVAPARALGPDGDRVRVVSAGKLGAGYLEKLARLDFAAAWPQASPGSAESPIERALVAMLRSLRKEKPEYILLDARAGLHDLSGISLHRLAHADVLVARASEQGYRGLDLALEVLVRRKGKSAMESAIVHTMVPGEALPESVAEEAEFAARTKAIFEQHVYGTQGTPIAQDRAAQHVPLVVRYDDNLRRFASVDKIERSLWAPGFVALKERIVDLCTPSDIEADVPEAEE
jgi:MinD-like ATPase involved in chromosome partitioning or flagellar assembly